MSVRDAAVIPLTGGAIRNGYIPLGKCLDLFSEDTLGGATDADRGERVTLEFSNGERAETDIRLGIRFRDRTYVPRFFTHEGLTEADGVLIRRLSPSRYAVSAVCMAAFSDGREFGSAEEYGLAFASRPPKDKKLLALQAHAERRIMTATALAQAASWPNYNSANLIYGSLGRDVGDALNLDLPEREGTRDRIGTYALADDAGRGGDPESGEFEWAIRPEVVEGMLLAGLLKTRPAWLDAPDQPPKSLTDADILELIEADPPKVWIKGYWDWTPETWGGVGFTGKNDRDRLLSEIGEDGGLVVIYGTQTGETNFRKRGKVLGVYAVTSESGSISNYVEQRRLSKARAGDQNSQKWEHAVRAVRAWGVPIELAPGIDELADTTYSPSNGQDIAARGRRLTRDEARKLLDYELEEQDVYGAAQVGLNNPGAFRDRLTEPSRGGAVTHSGFFVEPMNAPRHAYMLALSGDASAFLAGVRKVADGERIVKVGISRHPLKRCNDINRNYPLSAYRWDVIHSTFDERFSPMAPQLALNLETRIKAQLDQSAQSLGGEFFLVSQDAMDAAWQAIKIEYGKHQ